MPTLSGTSVAGRQVLFALLSTDTIWSIRVADPAFPANLQQKYYGFMSVEYTLSGIAQPFQAGGAALWTAGKIISVPRPVSATMFAVMHWRMGGIPFTAVSG